MATAERSTKKEQSLATARSKQTQEGADPLAQTARGLMARERLFRPGTATLAMVSGGQDSMALLHLLACGSAGRVGPTAVRALHVNHHLRGDDSDADEALVCRACAELGVTLVVAHRPIDKAAGGIQERAREARREAALSGAAEWGCETIALGHTADDQVETMLYRLARYGGLAAFRGMTPCDPPWVRPLLDCRREETAAYCRRYGIEFAEDEGNAYPGYARTGIRERVLPAWEACLPGAVEASARAAEVASELERLVADLLTEAGARVAFRASAEASAMSEAELGQTKELSVSRLLECVSPLRRLLLHKWLEEHARPAASRAAVLAVESLLSVSGSAARDLVGGWRACKEYDRLFLERSPGRVDRSAQSLDVGAGSAGRAAGSRDCVAPPVAAVPLTVPGEADWGDFRIHCAPVDRFCAPDVSTEAYVDARSLIGRLVVRGVLPGDRVRPLGAPGTRKLQDVLVDLRVPAAARAGIPLVVCDDEIVWVCGLLIGERGRISRDTSAVVRLWLERLHGDRGSGKTGPPGRGRHT